MLAVRLYDKQDLRVVEIERPHAGPGEMVLKVGAAAVCGTDVRMWQNGQKGVDAQHPMTLGHEFAGSVCEIGRGRALVLPAGHAPGHAAQHRLRHLRHVRLGAACICAPPTAPLASTWKARWRSM